MDVVSNILRTFKLKGYVFLHTSFYGAWAVDISGALKASFHMISRGTAWLHLPDQEHPIALQSGDLIVFPHDAPHAISNESAPPTEDTVFNNPGEPTTEGPSTGLICGYFEFERHSWNPLLDALPDVIIVKKGEDAGNAALITTVMQSIIVETEAEHAGGDVVIDKLSEVLFIHVIRHHIQCSKNKNNYLAALADKKIGRALACIHEKPGNSWSVDALAQRAGISRTVFSKKFRMLVNMTPMQYVTCWRMQRAHELFSSSNESVAQIAELLGYQSESAFSKSFKKHFNYGPGVVRKKLK